jgi:hypothetical protein
VSLEANCVATSNMDMVRGEEWLATVLPAPNVRVNRRSLAMISDAVFDRPEPKPQEVTWKQQFEERAQLARVAKPVDVPVAKPVEQLDATDPAYADPHNLEDDVIEAINEQVEGDRQELQAELLGFHCENFDIDTRSGKNTYEQSGHATNSIRSQAKGRLANDWCTMYAVPMSITFSTLNNMYDRHTIIIMAKYWAAKMQYLFNMYLLQDGKGRYTYTDDDLNGFVEPHEVVDLVAANPGDKVLQRITQIRNIRPK